jgi:hypothetical protein
MNLYLAFDTVCTFLAAHLIINAQKNMIPNNDKVRNRQSKYRLNIFSIAIKPTSHLCCANQLTISPNAPAHAYRGLTIIGQVHTRQPGPIEVVNILIKLHTRLTLNPTRDLEQERQAPAANRACLAINHLRSPWLQVDGAEEALSERWGGGREKCLPGPGVWIANFRWRVHEEGGDIQCWVAA